MNWIQLELEFLKERLHDIGIIPSAIFKASNGQFALKLKIQDAGFWKARSEYLNDWIGCECKLFWKFSLRELPYLVIILGWRECYATNQCV